MKKDKIKKLTKKLKELRNSGKTETNCAKELGISYNTYLKLKKENTEFKKASEISKSTKEKEVENALLLLALGGKEKIKKVYKLKESYYDENGKKVEKEHLEEKEEVIYTPPNLSAITFWLKCKNPALWGDKQTNIKEEIGDTGIILMPEVSKEGEKYE